MTLDLREFFLVNLRLHVVNATFVVNFVALGDYVVSRIFFYFFFNFVSAKIIVGIREFIACNYLMIVYAVKSLVINLRGFLSSIYISYAEFSIR